MSVRYQDEAVSVQSNGRDNSLLQDLSELERFAEPLTIQLQDKSIVKHSSKLQILCFAAARWSHYDGMLHLLKEQTTQLEDLAQTVWSVQYALEQLVIALLSEFVDDVIFGSLGLFLVHEAELNESSFAALMEVAKD